MEWEKPYLEALVDALKPSGAVLQVGFGHGYAALRIQTFKPKSHTIIEADPKIAEGAKEWGKEHSHVTVVEQPWHKALESLGAFDAIFFDDPLLRKDTIAIQKQQCTEGALFLRKGKELIASVKAQIPQVTTTHYSDRDIDDFYQKAGKFKPEVLPRFFDELKKNGQISEEQYKKALVKYKVAEAESHCEIADVAPVDQVLHFVEECLKNHLRKGGRIAWFSADPTSRYEDPQFFEKVITNPGLEYREHSVPVEPPEECTYFKASEAIVSVIERV